jgi:hypothetical protein
LKAVLAAFEWRFGTANQSINRRRLLGNCAAKVYASARVADELSQDDR